MLRTFSLWKLLLICVSHVPHHAHSFGSSSSSHGYQQRGSTSLSFSSSPPNDPSSTVKPSAIIVGGGPAGLATALILSRHHNYQVTIIESATQDTISEFDPSKAYLYNVNPRGQILTKRFPSLHKDLMEKGVGITQFERLTVPADPKEVFTNEPFSRDMSEEEKKRMGILYWIPRHEFVNILLKEIAKDGDDDDGGSITICYGMKCEQVQPTPEGTGIEVTTVSKYSNNNHHQTFHANLVVGADGINSKVRHALSQSQSRFHPKWNNANPRLFRARQYNTPSVGLRIKTLQIQPNFQIPVGDSTFIPAGSTANYQLSSVNKDSKHQISMMLLPMRNSTAIRPSAVCTLSNHHVWKLKSGSEMRDWFAASFPRFNMDTLVAEEEWDRFAKSEGSRFPPCQYSKGLAVSCSSSSQEDHESSAPGGGVGVVLVGDSIHAFPPDLGQGVNAALGDVAVLDDVLKEEGGDLVRALDKYQHVRAPETRALVRLARVGAPYQYRQSSLALTIRRNLWTANIALRLLLNKIISTPKPAVLQMMDPNVTFQTIMRRADAVTAMLSTILLAIVWKLGKALLYR